ncbi:hypothetical protein E9840_11515 [Tissierella creatinini]|nr:hypothetical protein E9840_11515 [Tissierella creatinini]TJX61081.1 hypothetical protein E8P77_18870 [Soehngenia saccharolytica]
MIKVDDYEILSKNISTLKETSRDYHDEVDHYMTDSLLPAVDFDKVKDEYISKLSISDKPKSNDTLFIDSEGKEIFIEFKNGFIENKKFELRKKIYDSLLIYTDIIHEGISYTRQHVDYILVYNEEKNRTDKQESKTHIQNSKSRDRIAKGFSKLGGTNYIKFGLEIFKGYCFREVNTYTEGEFKEFLNNQNRTGLL